MQQQQPHENPIIQQQPFTAANLEIEINESNRFASRPSISNPIVQSKTVSYSFITQTYFTWSLVNVIVSFFMGFLG